MSTADARLTLVIRLALTVLFAALLWRFASFVAIGARAVAWPFELNYGEGIVWEQALLLSEGRAYGPIDAGLPAIVFHYTPLYHAICLLVADVTGGDLLAVGRLVTLAATVGAALVVGWLAACTLPEDARSLARLVVAAVGALTFFCYHQILLWAPLMRVDMLPLFLTLLGFALGLKAIERPQLILPSALFFVAAVYTKQTAIAAPVALFLFLLAVRPRTAFAGIAIILVAGLATLATFAWYTNGRFIDHIFLYNINRLELSRLSMIFEVSRQHLLLISIALLVSLRQLAKLGANSRRLGWAGWREWLTSRRDEATFAALSLYLLFASATLLFLAKSGSDDNYLIEWLAVLSVFLGIAVWPAVELASGQAGAGWRARLVAVGVPIAVAVQVPLVASPYPSPTWSREREAELRHLSAIVRASDKPVLSDDMVLLLRSGQRVMWEPAIFAELASTGAWDERPLVEQVRRGDFAFFITVASDCSYNPAVAAAVNETYPVQRQVAGYTLHLRPDSPLLSALSR